MARILCAYSGIDFRVDHFPIYNTSRESHHPIFDLSPTTLVSLTPQWVDGKLTATDTYLYYLALFKSTQLVDFRVPAIQTSLTQSIIANNMYCLLRMVDRISTLGEEKVRYSLSLPQFVISQDTKDLGNTKYWLEIWEKNYDDYKTGYQTSTLIDKISRKEHHLERMIKDRNKDISTYAGTLAEWASLAGDFPTWNIELTPDILGPSKTRLTCAEYWKTIIKLCAKKEPVYSIPDADIEELIEHCEDTLHQSGIYFFELMSLLRNASKKKLSYLALGDVDITSTYRILDASSSVEDANMLAMIDSAPKDKPIEKDYPNKLAYIRAKMKYDVKLAYEAEHPVLLEVPILISGDESATLTTVTNVTTVTTTTVTTINEENL